MRKPMTESPLHQLCIFNRDFPAGSTVMVDCGPGRAKVRSRIRAPGFMLGGKKPCVFIESYSSPVDITRIGPISALEAALLAAAMLDEPTTHSTNVQGGQK